MPHRSTSSSGPYFRDLRWLQLSLLSVARFAEGYRRVIVVMPRSSAERFSAERIYDPSRTTVEYCDDYADDYVGQQVSKLHADLYTDAKLIVHIDSDCIFDRPCNMSELVMTDGRPVIRILSRSRRPATDGWRHCVTELHGQQLPFDPLTPAPWAYLRDLYSSLRETCLRRHNAPLEAWCLERRCDNISEFSLLAAEAWLHHRDEYHWMPIDYNQVQPCRQYWSRSPSAHRVRAKIAHQLDWSLP